MANVCVSFKVLKRSDTSADEIGKGKQEFKYVGTNIIFDIKMDGKFTTRARLVTGVHKTASPLTTTYSSVVTRESVGLEFIIAGLNDLYICA